MSLSSVNFNTNHLELSDRERLEWIREVKIERVAKYVRNRGRNTWSMKRLVRRSTRKWGTCRHQQRSPNYGNVTSIPEGDLTDKEILSGEFD